MMHDTSSGANPSSTSYSQHSAYRSTACSPSSSTESTRCCFSRKKPQKSSKNPREDSVLCCCCTCPTPTSSASVLTCLGVCILVLVYTLLGAFAFMALEGTFSSNARDIETSVAASQPNPSTTESLVGAEIRSKTVDKLWSITEDLNILYKDNWTRLAAQEVMEFQDTLVRAMKGNTGVSHRQRGTSTYSQGSQHRWSFSSSFLYSLTLITTIGYGNVTPVTAAGKLVTIAYALLGIPLMLVYLSTVGDVLARSFRRLYSKTCRPSRPTMPKLGKGQKPTPTLSANLNFKSSSANHIPDGPSKGFYGDIKSNESVVILDCVDTTMPLSGTMSAGGISSNLGKDSFARKRFYHRGCPDQIRVPISLCMLIIIIYMSLGAVIFNKTENWTLLDGSYFCFTSLSTVGFGDLYPGQHASKISAQAEDIALCVCSVYILIGMAVIAMCFNLVQDEIIVLVRKFNRACGGQTKHHMPPRSIDELEAGEDISMSIVS